MLDLTKLRDPVLGGDMIGRLTQGMIPEIAWRVGVDYAEFHLESDDNEEYYDVSVTVELHLGDVLFLTVVDYDSPHRPSWEEPQWIYNATTLDVLINLHELRYNLDKWFPRWLKGDFTP